MKTSLVALILTVVSSSAFATSPEISCSQSISMSRAEMLQQADALESELTNLVNEQIREDGEPAIARCVNGRLALLGMVKDVVNSISSKGASKDAEEMKMSADLCKANLNVREYVLSR